MGFLLWAGAFVSLCLRVCDVGGWTVICVYLRNLRENCGLLATGYWAGGLLLPHPTVAV